MENDNLEKKEENVEAKDKNIEANKDALVKPDPETVQKTDPQEDMEGPISSFMHKSSKLMESDKTKEEAQKRKDDNL